MLNNPTLPPVAPQLPQRELGAALDALISLYDAAGGDPDLEADGDELTGKGAEDDFLDQRGGWSGGPGCPISDGVSAVDDGPCDEPSMDLEPGTARLIPLSGVDQTKLPIKLYGEGTVRYARLLRFGQGWLLGDRVDERTRRKPING